MTALKLDRGGKKMQRTISPGSWLLGVMIGLGIVSGSARGADLATGEALFRSGQYDECATMAAQEIAAGAEIGWHMVLVESHLARGRTQEALAAVEAAIERFPRSVSLRLLARRARIEAGQDPALASDFEAIEEIIVRSGGRFSSPLDRIALGRYFLMRGADPRTVLERFYDVSLKENPDLLEGYFAAAELALAKDDFALAAATLKKAPPAAAQDPRSHALLARAYDNDDPAGSAREVAAALKLNPRHVESLLLAAEHKIDAERYAESAETLKAVLAVNPREPRAHAYLAALAMLRSKDQDAAALKAQALANRPRNPEVDYLIGRTLSAKYRFEQGAKHQREALTIDPDYAPAKLQLCQDLLRLGDEAEGWKLAAQVLDKDAYNVVAYNLVSLRDHLKGFRTIEADGIVLRMDPREADLYGDRALALLKRARATLAARYGVTLSSPITVEIFPERKDFAVRTFGLPGADGLLGVCFGKVVTANSPRSQGEHPANLEAVLWHEFCHVITLARTRNRMPRWLSEGISVHEEARADPAWATALNPTFRKLILGPELTPLSQLSSAFLNARTALHVQFAYFESALAVEFLESRFGLDTIKWLLDDLGNGQTLEDALPKRSKMTLTQIDQAFGDFARQRAKGTASQATWEEPELPAGADAKALGGFVAEHPNSFWGLRRLAARLVDDRRWGEATTVLEKLKGLYPEFTGPDNAYTLLAAVHRGQGDAAAEERVLEELAARSGDAAPAFARLMELARARGDWAAVARNARRMLAVNPLVSEPHRMLALAAEKTGTLDEAIAAARAVVLLDQIEPAGAHYQLASLLARAGKPAEARRETLKAIEEAPRFLAAYRLLLDLGSEPAAGARSLDSKGAHP